MPLICYDKRNFINVFEKTEKLKDEKIEFIDMMMA